MEPVEGLRLLLSECRVSADSSHKFKAFLMLLLKWSARINLTSSTQWDFLKPLFWEGIWASGFYPSWSKRHLDIGSGAGFPGIPLAILAPHAKLDMVESRVKRAYFLESVISELGLGGARVHQMRLQEFLAGHHEPWDCFSWKGLKLGARDLERLSAHADSRSMFWMFHGKDLALEDPEGIKGLLEVVSSERFPGRNEWKLSILKKVPGSEFPIQG